MGLQIAAESFLYDLRLVRSRLADVINSGQLVNPADLVWCVDRLTEVVEMIEDAQALYEALLAQDWRRDPAHGMGSGASGFHSAGRHKSQE